MSETELNSALAYLRKIADNDTTITTRNYPWTGYSIAYTIYDSDSDIGQGITESYLGEGRSQTPPQLFGLASIVSPLLRIGDQITSSIQSYEVVLDAETWERPQTQLSAILDSISWTPDIEFKIKDSKQIPGIQLADIASHARRKRLHDGSCYEGMEVLNTLLL